MATAKKRTATRSKAKMMDDGARGGFTIIEVVLVLAIAGLIFLMVFLALPALQRSQRDTQRRQTLNNVRAAVMNYQNNNNGRLPCVGTKASACADVASEPGGSDIELKSLPFYNSANTNPVAGFIVNYLNGADSEYSEFVDPNGDTMGLSIRDADDGFTLTADDYKEHMVYIFKGARCDGEEIKKSDNSRDFVVMYKLEGGGVYCE